MWIFSGPHLIIDDFLFRVGLRRGHSEHSEWEVVRPGVIRLNLPWWSSEEEIQFILSALEIVVNEGWKLLPVYRWVRIFLYQKSV